MSNLSLANNHFAAILRHFMQAYSTEHTNILYIIFSFSADIPQLRAASPLLNPTLNHDR